jgi:uncharacterized protein (TIGR02646 family)
MRRVDRSLHQPSQEWFEKADKLKHKTKPESFNAQYRDADLQATLLKLFHLKCAYCEAIDNTLEVDHFRPKGSVAEEPQHDGYYWLAYQWENLLPACAACNKRLTDRGRKPGKGKLAQFPLRSGSPRAFKPTDDLGQEQRLLLDPCEDEPKEHLRLLPDGTPEARTEMGKTSIEVYFLDQSTKTFRRKSALDRLARAHKLANLEELKVILSDEAEFCGLLREHYSNLVGCPWRTHLSNLERTQAQQAETDRQNSG